ISGAKDREGDEEFFFWDRLARDRVGGQVLEDDPKAPELGFPRPPRRVELDDTGGARRDADLQPRAVISRRDALDILGTARILGHRVESQAEVALLQDGGFS